MALSKIPNGNEEPKGTRGVWSETNEFLKDGFTVKEKSISRASVINFLTKLARLGLIEGVSGTGKGGTRFNYRFIAGRHFFNVQVASMLLGAIIEELPDVDVPWTLTASPELLAEMAQTPAI